MPRPMPLLLHDSRRVLHVSQNELAARLGVSRRTGQRWTKGSGPDGTQLHGMARLVFPVDAALAAEIAEAAGTTLDALGLLPASAPGASPSSVVPTERVVDAVVCAAAEAMQVVPQQVRPALLAAFACARELGLTLEDVERVLRAKASRPA
jgi:transcriptional regulator with XRE-family HTH domain